MKIDFEKKGNITSYTQGRVYFDSSTHTIKVATGTNQYIVYSGVRSADYDEENDVLTIVNQDGYEFDVNLAIDAVPTEDSSNAVSSGGVYQTIADTERVIVEAINDLNDRSLALEYFTRDIDDKVYDLSTALDNKLDSYTFNFSVNNKTISYNSGNYGSANLILDSVPTKDASLHGVTSAGLYTIITENERVVAEVFDDLNNRLQYIEGLDIALNSSIPTSLDDISDGSTRKLSDFAVVSSETHYITSSGNGGINGFIGLDGSTYALPNNGDGEQNAMLASLADVTYRVDNAQYVNDASYDSSTKRINLKHNSTVLAYIDATAFIKDGMVSDVSIHNGTGANASTTCLVVSFNTDAGKDNIELPLTSIFNPSNYYDKTAADNKFVSKISSSDNAIVRFDGTDGSIQNSAVTIDDSGNIVSSGALYLTNIASSVTNSTSRLYFGSSSSPYNYITANTTGVFGIYRASDGKGIACYPSENFFSNNNIDLGRSNSLWKNLYLSGTIGNGTYTWTMPSATGTLALTSQIPTSLDNISDGNTRKLSNYLPLTGGTMIGDASINFSYDDPINTEEPGTFLASIAPGIMRVAETRYSISIYLDALAGEIKVGQENGSFTTISVENIRHGDSNNTYTYTFPSASGTLALTSQLPSAVTESTVSGWGFTKNAGTLTGVKFNNVSATVSNGVASITATIPPEVTESTVSGWGFTKNTGTLTAHAKHKLITTDGSATSTSGTITFVESVSGTTTATDGDLSLTTTRKSVTIPSAVTESTVSGWGFTKNAGTLTSHADHKLLIGSASATAASSNTITYVESLTGTSTATHGDLTVTPTLKTITIPSAVTESTVSGWGFTKNTGTLTEHATHKLTATNNNATSTSGTITFVESLTGTNTATSGDLTITATRKSVTIPAAQVQSDWNATSGMGVILNKPTIPSAPGTLKTNNTSAQTASASEALSGTINLHKVAKTGTYSDLIGTPTIPTVNNATLTIQKNGTTVNTFTANASSNVTANIQVNELPTVTSSDNGKILQVVSGAWATVTPVSIYSGYSAPASTLGVNGDIYIQTDEQ